MKILARNPFLFAEPGKGQNQRQKKPQIKPQERQKKPQKMTPVTPEDMVQRQRDIEIEILKGRIKARKAKKAAEAKEAARKAKEASKEKNPEAKTESSDTKSFQNETKVPETPPLDPPLDQILSTGLKRHAERQKTVVLKRFQEFKQLNYRTIREILTELHDLHEEHVDLICSIERVKFMYDTQQKDEAPFASTTTKTYSEREARVEQMKQLEKPSNLFLQMLDGDLSEDEYRQLFLYCNTLQSRREQIIEERKVLLRDDAVVSATRDELYYVMRHGWSKTFGKPSTVADVKKYIKFEISQEELALCVEQTKMKFLQSQQEETSTIPEHFSSYFAMNIDSMTGHEDYLLSKITPDVRLDHIQEHLDTLRRVLEKDDVQQILDKNAGDQKRYEQLLDKKAVVYFEQGRELSKGQDIELNFLARAFIKVLPSFLFSAEESSNNKKLDALNAREQQLDDEEMEYTLAGNLGLASSDRYSFTKTVEWFRMRRRILQRGIVQNKIKHVLQRHTAPTSDHAKKREEKKRKKEEAILSELGTEALKELQQMTPWYVDHGWSPRTKNVIRLIFGGIQVGNTVINTVNECVHAAARLEEQRRQSQTLTDAFERELTENTKRWNEEDSAANRARVQAKKDAAAQGGTSAEAQTDIENTRRHQAHRARVQAKKDAAAQGGTSAEAQTDIDRQRQHNEDLWVQTQVDEAKTAQFKNDFQADVAEPTLRSKRANNIHLSKCADFTPFGLVTGDGRMVNEANGFRTEGGFAVDGECAVPHPPASDTGGGFISTYANYILDGEWFDDTANGMLRLSDPNHRYGYDYFFKNYIQENPNALDAKLTQEQWNGMSMADKAPYMQEFHRLYPSIGGVSVSAKPSGGGFHVTDQNGRIIGEYNGRIDPHSTSRLPADWWENIKYADGITPLERQHPVYGGGVH